jgi:DNA primase
MRARLASNAAAVKTAVLAILPELVRQWLPDGEYDGVEYIALNPRRNDRNKGSFRINTFTGQWREYAIGERGSDGVSLYAYLRTDGDYRAAFKMLANDPLVLAAVATGLLAPPAKTAKAATPAAAKLALVRRIYAEAVDLAGMPAAAYLQNRGLRPTVVWEGLRASVLRYPGVGRHPVLIAPVRALDGSLAGLHRTYLQPNGAKLGVANPKLTLGQVRGNAIHLGEATDRLIICEGLEDGLTLYQELGVPVWVACGASFLHLLALPDTVRSLTIAADNDPPGEKAAWRAVDAHSTGGRVPSIMRPSSGFADFNDELRGIES